MNWALLAPNECGHYNYEQVLDRLKDALELPPDVLTSLEHYHRDMLHRTVWLEIEKVNEYWNFHNQLFFLYHIINACNDAIGYEPDEQFDFELLDFDPAITGQSTGQ